MIKIIMIFLPGPALNCSSQSVPELTFPVTVQKHTEDKITFRAAVVVVFPSVGHASIRSHWLASRFQRIRSDCPTIAARRPHPSPFLAGPVQKIPSSLLANYEATASEGGLGSALRRPPPRLLLRPRIRPTSVLILPPTLEIRRRNLILGDGCSVRSVSRACV